MSLPELDAGLEIPSTTFEDPFSYDVWKSTYKHYTDDTIDETLRRVARFVASAEETELKKEEWEEKFFDTLSEFKCTAGGRIYSNAGTEWHGTTLMNCFDPSVTVLTAAGPKQICDVEVGEYVLTHRGRYRRVVNTLKRHYVGLVQRFSSSYFSDDIISTPEHPYYQGGGRWKNSEDVNAVVLAYSNDHSDHIVLDLADFFDSNNVVVEEEQIYTRRSFIGGNNAKGTKRGHSVKRFVQVDGNFAYLLGRFVGDGCVFQTNKNSLFEVDAFNVAFNASTEDLSANLLAASFENYFGIQPNLISSQNNTLYVRKASQIVAEVLRQLIGHGYDNKHIPSVIWNSSVVVQRSFLHGLYDADGFVTERGALCIEMTNPSLIREVQTLATIASHPSTRNNNRLFAGSSYTADFRMALTKKYEDRRLNFVSSKPPTTGPVSLLGEGFAVIPERTDEEYNGYVYNISVEEDESYVVNNVVVHNCFVSPRTGRDFDSLEMIVKDLYNQMQTLKSEGGWGQNFSWLRPRGAFIHGIGVETPGAVKYMEMYDKASDIITAGSGKESINKKAKGKIRKGAMMGVLDVWHPDIVEFISAKQNQGRLTKFNVSVNCTDEFMQAVKDNAKWNLRFPDTTFEKYEDEWNGDIKRWEQRGYPTITYRTVEARWLWNLIMESTYNRAEPGVLFLDRANHFNPLNYAETIYATNPCGEQTLAPGGVCNLGSINLTQFVNADRTGFDLEKVTKYTKRLVRFLDNINSLSNAPLPEYVDSMRKKRRIGCGILGWGSALFMLRLRFGSEQANQLRDEVMKTIARTAYMASIDLAIEKGAFEYCDGEKHAQNPFVVGLRLPKEYQEKLRKTGIRNSSLLSIQPTGNTSILANVVSGGLEPIFMPEYIRTVIVNSMPKEIEELTPKWYEGEWRETEMFKFVREGDEEILKGEHDGTIYKIDKNRGLTKEVLCEDYGVRFLKARGQWDPTADWAVTTANLIVRDHVNDLKGFARWVDSAMSKTVNVPHDYPFENFKDIYLEAYNSGYVKGVTTYRAGTMTAVLAAKDEVTADADDEEIIYEDYKVPAQAPATMNTIRADGKKWYLTVILNEQQTRPIALFVHTNHPEKNVTTHDATELLLQLARDKGIPERWVSDTEEKFHRDNNATKIARAISLCLRHGVLIKNIVATLDQVDNVFVGTFLFQVKKFLMSFLREGERVQNGDCPECGTNNFIYSEGCIKCGDCGYSKCG